MEQEGKKLSVTWRGQNFIFQMNPSATLKDLADKLQSITNVKSDTLRLIVPTNKGSKLFYPYSAEHSYVSLETASLLEGKSVRMMGVPETEVDEIIQNSRTDLRIAGFDDEEKRMRSKILDGQYSFPKLPQGNYIFADFKTLDIPGVELNPPASEALKLMHRLAADPGIVAIMNKHRWRVGIMTEMAPVGYVGVSPKCILGFNKNHGEEISLRLRTDDLTGFRKYQSIKMTLLHELAHMVHSEHDANFHALDKKLNEEAATLDWTKSKGQTISGVRHSIHSEEKLTNHSTSQKLGGMVPALSNARTTSVAAAYQRYASSTITASKMGDKHDEPDPDDSQITISLEPDYIRVEGKMETGIIDERNKKKFLGVLESHQKHGDPGNEESDGAQEVIDAEPCLDSGENIVVEMHADGSEVTVGPFSKSTASEGAGPNSFEVSAMDEVMVEQGYAGATSSDNPNGVKAIHPEQNPDPSGSDDSQSHHIDTPTSSCSEPSDPDNSQLNKVALAKPGQDVNIMLIDEGMRSTVIDESDLDDNEFQRIQDPVATVFNRLLKAAQMLRSELSSSTAALVLQTIFKIIGNVIEHPDDMKFRKIRKANPIIQRNVVSYQGAMEILHLVGFFEDVIFDNMGNAETFLVLKRNDPGLLWLAKGCVESFLR